MVTSEEVLRRLKPSCVKIETWRKGLPENEENKVCGSGNVIMKSGSHVMILSCGHLFEKSFVRPSTIRVIFSNGVESLNFKVVTSEIEASMEVALLFGYDESLESMICNPVCVFSQVEEFERVFCGSYTYGVPHTVMVEGTVSGFHPEGSIAFDISTSGGSSGASIVNEELDIVSVFMAGTKYPIILKRQAEHDEENSDDDDDDKMMAYAEGTVKYGLRPEDIIIALNGFCRSKDVERGPDIASMLAALFTYFRDIEQKERKKNRKKEKKKKRKRSNNKQNVLQPQHAGEE